jgi:hypothetical protein
VAVQASLPSILRDHAQRYPRWTEVDLYKLLHQAERGSQHAVVDRRRASRWLERELAQLGPGPVEPLIDPIRADGRIVRIHLRPWQDRGLTPVRLLGAFLETANGWQEPADGLEEALQTAVRLAKELGLDPKALADFVLRMTSLGFPAVHHSPGYQAAYRPAYRVVAATFLPDALGFPFPG